MRIAKSGVVLLLMLVFLACSTARPSCRPTTRPNFSADGEGTKFTLETLEFDDFGVDCSDTQLGRVLKKIHESNAAAPKSGAITAVFVHGWHNGPVTGNLTAFVQEFLKPLADNEWKRNPQQPRRILGIYIAWRGARWNGAADFLPASYYDRDAAAKRIGSGDVLQDLVAIMTATSQGENAKYSRSVFFGHSMGGLILERAFTTAMRSYIASIYQTERSYPWNPPADLVVTLNPAASAMEAWRFKRMLGDWKINLSPRDSPFTEGEDRPWSPLIISIASEGDWATSSVMAAAATLGTLTADFGADNLAGRPLSRAKEKRLRRFAPGFTCDLLTHIVVRETAAGSGLIPSPCTLDYLQNAQPSPLGWTVRLGATGCTQPAIHRAGDPRACAEVGGDRFRLLEIDRSGDRDFYWIMRVPNDVISGHSMFFTAPSRHLIHGLTAVTEAMAISWEEPEIPRTAYAMTEEGERQWRAAESLRRSMFGEQRAIMASGGPPGVCELPPSTGFRVAGACDGTSDTEITCSPEGGEVTLTALPEAVAQSQCANIEWLIGDARFTGPTVRFRLSGALRAIMIIRSDRAPLETRTWLFPRGVLPPGKPPAAPKISYRGERSGCAPAGVPCHVDETVTFSAASELSDPPMEWGFGRGVVHGTSVTHRFTIGGRQRVAAIARNRSSSTAAYVDVDVTSCDQPPASIAIRYTGRTSNCNETQGDCQADELVTYRIDGGAHDCATVEWRFADGETAVQREVERRLAERERVSVTLKTNAGISTATAMLTGRPRGTEIVDLPFVQRPCTTCCSLARKLETTHEVLPGDWLSKIALARYGTLDWSRIYDLNRRILKHPDVIRPGQILRIPVCDPPTEDNR